MATTVLKDQYIGYTDYNSGGYHKGYYRCGGFTYDSVTRSGNTVTLNNCRISSYVQLWRTNGSYFGYSKVWYGWIGLWESSNTRSGSTPKAKTSQFKLANAGNKFYDNPHTYYSGNLSMGNISFTVSGDGAGTKTFWLGMTHTTSNSNSDSTNTRDSSDPAPSFTVSYPANTVVLKVVASRDGTTLDSASGLGTFDVTVGGTKVGENVNVYNASVQVGSSYTVDDIQEVSDNYYFTGSSSYTDTISSATTITLPYSSTTLPTGITPTLISRTYNSIVARATVSSYGAPSARTGRYVEVGIAPATATSYGSGIILKQYAYDTTSTANKTFNQTNDTDSLIIAGARSFKIGGYATNTKKHDSTLLSTVYWLPPAPLKSVVLDDSVTNPDNVTHTIHITGAPADNVSNITNARVNTQYRTSYDGGLTFSNWITVSSNISPATMVTASITVPYNTEVLFQARQCTTGDTTQSSDITDLTIEAIAPVPPVPTIRYSYDELNRTMTITVSGGAGYGTTFASRDLQLKYFEDVSFVDVNLTTDPSVYTISYLKPNARLLISARTNNTDGGSSEWLTVETTVRRPIWGIVTRKNADDEDEQFLIRDMVKVRGGGVSQRDWIEGQFVGKKRIVKN